MAKRKRPVKIDKCHNIECIDSCDTTYGCGPKHIVQMLKICSSNDGNLILGVVKGAAH